MNEGHCSYISLREFISLSLGSMGLAMLSASDIKPGNGLEFISRVNIWLRSTCILGFSDD